jgi:transposase-like protein
MGRKTKYSKEFKLEIVKRYLKGESASLLANEYSIGEKSGANIIGEWVRKYNTLGDKAFNETFANKSYSKKLKERIIKEYLEGNDLILL